MAVNIEDLKPGVIFKGNVNNVIFRIIDIVDEEYKVGEFTTKTRKSAKILVPKTGKIIITELKILSRCDISILKVWRLKWV